MKNNKIKNNKKPFFRFVKKIIKIFKKKPKIINYNEFLEDGAIYISNHSGANGLLTYELYFPKFFRFWGTYEMCGKLKEIWKYLANVYFPNKKHYSKTKSKILATIGAPFMRMFYKGMQVIPTYPDARLRNTFNTSYEELNKGINLIIFPENSSDGYHNVLKEYYSGFMSFAKFYNKKTQKNLKIYNMYYSKKHNTIIIDKAISYRELKESGKNDKEIAEDFKNKINIIAKEHFPEIN